MPLRFSRTLEVAAPVSVLWAFHARPEVIAALQPPWQRTEILRPPASLEVGTRVEVKVWLGPIPMTIVAEHVAYEAGRRFVDRMLRGPFRSWRHEHRFEALDAGASRLVDDIAYELPGGALGRLLAGAAVARQLDRLFAFRHGVTREWVEPIFHIADAAAWRAARAGGMYRAPSLESEGFIHCSSRPQLEPVARALFAGQRDLVVLRLDASRLPVRWEEPARPAPAPGPFPHVYGPIPVAAVVDVTRHG